MTGDGRSPPVIGLYASQLAPEGGPSGVHRYAAELATWLSELFPDRYRLLASAEHAEPTWTPGTMPVTRLPGPRRLLHLGWALAGRPRIDRFVNDLRLLHVLYPAFPVPSRVPVVYTFHDIFPIRNPEWYEPRARRLFKAAARDARRRAARIIAVSDWVAQAVADELTIERSRITVIHEGVSERFFAAPTTETVSAVCSTFGIEPQRYVLYVGAVSPRKNIITLVRAIERVDRRIRLVVAGHAGAGAELLSGEIERLRLTERVLMAGRVDDPGCAALMAGSLALVHPSLDEGFGLTPLEALAIGTPAIASRSGALPEVLGDAAVLLDPQDVDAWAAAMDRIGQDRAYAAALVEKGKQRARLFTWERAARETAAVHEAVLAGTT